MNEQEFISKINNGQKVTMNEFDYWSRNGKYYWAKTAFRDEDFDEVLFLGTAEELWLMSVRNSSTTKG
ncbi:MAG: hypothetical protein MUO85_02280 [candidate division Zixibacteria bacterium]|nr:hypothetical protein [candidate division Zixibacteria bacterium]